MKEFCAPFTGSKTKKFGKNGRAMIDLPSGKEAFEYGMVLVRLGIKRILIMSVEEFHTIFAFVKTNGES